MEDGGGLTQGRKDATTQGLEGRRGGDIVILFPGEVFWSNNIGCAECQFSPVIGPVVFGQDGPPVRLALPAELAAGGAQLCNL